MMSGRRLSSVHSPLEIRAPQEASVNQNWTASSPLSTVQPLTARLDHVQSGALVIVLFLYCVLMHMTIYQLAQSHFLKVKHSFQ